MELLNRRVPAYMYERTNLIRLVIFTALFALVFINIYKPFSSENWYPVSEFMFFVFSSFVILTGVLVVVISRIFMYYYAGKHTITYGKFTLWILAEIFFMSLFYTVYTLFLNTERDVWQTFQDCITNTSLVLLLPYMICLLYFSWRDKELQLQQIGEEKTEPVTKQIVYSFYDEKGDLRLSVIRANLLYIESADNYVIIWYLNKGALTRFLLRNKLKTLEEQFSDTNVLRCHRSYMVNLDQVKVIRREKDGIYLELGVDKAPDIPISKTYSEKIMHWFTRYSS